MFKQRGMAQGWIAVIGLLAILGALWGIIHAATSYVDGVRVEAKKGGKDECDAAYKERDNVALTEALAKVRELQTAARKLETANAKETERIRSQLEKEKARGKATEDRVLADIASGKLRVRGDAFQAGACPAESATGTAGAVGANTGGGDGAPRCKLSGETEKSVLGIGREADDVVRQLDACKAVAIEDRRVCNAP